jgi:hypothetical protein
MPAPLVFAVVSHQVACYSLTTTASQLAPSFATGVAPCPRCRGHGPLHLAVMGRFQVIYQVPERYWDGIVTRKYKTGITDAEGKPRAGRAALDWLSIRCSR